MIKVEITGIDEISRRFRAFPGRYRQAWEATLKASLLAIWNVVSELAYPPKPPTSKYTRTGKLGASVGITMGGGRTGRPDIFEVKHGGGHHEATFGSRLKYAQYVIGENQAWMHKGRWWTLPGTVAKKAVKEIEKLFKIMVDEMARWLDGKGL